MITPALLVEAEGVWFTSSVRGLAEIRSIDGVELPLAADTEKIRSVLGFAA